MKTTKPELVALELSTLDAWRAYMALEGLVGAWPKMPSRTFTKVRRLRRELQPVYEDREAAMSRVFKDYAKQENGQTVFRGNGDVEWEDAAGAEEVQAINDERRQFEIAPIPWAEIVPEPKDEDDLGPDVVNPSAVMALMDWGLIADDPSADGDGAKEAAQRAAAEEGG